MRNIHLYHKLVIPYTMNYLFYFFKLSSSTLILNNDDTIRLKKKKITIRVIKLDIKYKNIDNLRYTNMREIHKRNRTMKIRYPIIHYKKSKERKKKFTIIIC